MLCTLHTSVLQVAVHVFSADRYERTITHAVRQIKCRQLASATLTSRSCCLTVHWPGVTPCAVTLPEICNIIKRLHYLKQIALRYYVIRQKCTRHVSYMQINPE